MAKVLKYGLTLVVGGAVLLVGWGSMNLVTPTPEQMRVKLGPIPEEAQNSRDKHTAQMLRFLQANARSDNPVWKFDTPPQMASLAPKLAPKLTPAQTELAARNVELKRRSEEKRKRGVKPGSKSDKLIKDIGTHKYE